MQAGRPQWSPDGKSIAFTGNKDGQPGRVYVIPSGGGTLRLVGAEPYESDASWSPDGNWLLLARRVPAGAPGRPGLYLLDWKSGGMEFVPGSESFLYAAWSPNSRYIAATGEDAQAHVFDFQTRRWAPLSEGTELGYPFWSHDGKFVYIQDVLGAEDQPIFRVRIGDGRIERMMSGGQIPQSDVTGYTLSGLGPDDSPIATVIRSNSDIYALGVDLP
jgi:Tol biopolymer transport system component